MAWPYHFPSSNSPEIVAQRRQSLDFYARLAQISIFVPLLFIIVFRILHLSLTKFAGVNEGRLRRKKSPIAKILSVWRRIAWWADDDVGSWGTRRELLWAAVWAIWLGILAVKGTGDGE